MVDTTDSKSVGFGHASSSLAAPMVKHIIIHLPLILSNYISFSDMCREGFFLITMTNPLSLITDTRSVYNKTKNKIVVEGFISFYDEDPVWIPIETIESMFYYMKKHKQNDFKNNN